MNETPGFSIEGTLHEHQGTGVLRVRAIYETNIDDVWSALTQPPRLARWYGNFEGDFRVGGKWRGFVPSSEWDGHGRIIECDAPRRLSVTMWETEGEEQAISVDLAVDGARTILLLEKSGVVPDVLWAYGCGWQSHLEDLAAHLAGREDPDWPASTNARFDELEPIYRELPVTLLP